MAERIREVLAKDEWFGSPYRVGYIAEQLALALPTLTDPKQRADFTGWYAGVLLNAGEPAKALEQYQSYEHQVRESAQPLAPGAHVMLQHSKALCYLRMGEQENCVTNHNGDSCLLPIRGGGVHKAQAGSRGAIETLTPVLERYPGDIRARWLLNLAYMTLGEYPDKVPAPWRIDPRCFESEYPLPRFNDVAGAAGVDVDDLAGGVVMDDFDNDGLLDLMVSSWGATGQLRLFRNAGTGQFVDRTAAAGLIGATASLNLIQADYNNDGFVDVLMLRGAWLGMSGKYPDSLLRNNGDGTFDDVTEEAGLLGFHPSQAATWFDYNGDGYIDLFIGNESDGKDANPCQLFRNNGDGTFTECAAENGVDLVAFVKGVVAADFNNDGRPDLYASRRDGANILLRNDGPADAGGGPRSRWKFTNIAAEAGVTEPFRSFSCWTWDFDNDGWLDLAVTGYGIQDVSDVAADVMGLPTAGERARLYRNKGDGTFADVTREYGLNRVLHTMGCNFGDLDNDGWLDFYVGTGDPDFSTLIPNRMFRNDGGRRFQDVTTAGGFGQLQKGHGIAFGDLNNDGAQDIYSVVGGAVPGDHYPNQLFANPLRGKHWLKLKLEGVRSNRSALGARIRVVVATADGERSIYRVVTSGGSFGASPLQQHVGLDSATVIKRVEIQWPATGETQVVRELEPDRSYRIREGGAAEALLAAHFEFPTSPAGHSHPHHAGPAVAVGTPSPSHVSLHR